MKVNMKVKIIALTLLVSLAVASFTGCADSDKNANAEFTVDILTETDESATLEETTEIERPELPKVDYGGYEFRSLSRGNSSTDGHWVIVDTISYDDKKGDAINDAVFERNLYIEETYNAKITMITDSGCQGKAKASILAASDDFDVFGDSIMSSTALASEGLMIDFNTVPYLNLDKEWWDQNARNQLSISGKLFTMVSDMTLMDKNATWIIMFTKPMIDTYKLENPYELVVNNKWTLDKMYDMCTDVSRDVNGDGVLDDSDSFGTVGEPWNANSLMAGAGTTIFTKDDKDIPVFSMNNERVINAFEKVNKILADKNLTAFTDRLKGKYTDPWTDGFGGMMEDGRALFYITGMNRVTLLRGLETDFGILPNPKYDESQENYCHAISYGNANSISIPITNVNLDRTGVILEAVTFESTLTSYPAYIDTSIKTKYSRDEESVEMLDIIFESRIFDLGFIYNWGGASNIYSSNVNKLGVEITSKIAKAETATIEAMKKTVTQYQEMAN